MGRLVRVNNFSFFSGVYMTIYKRYAIKNQDTIKVIYLIDTDIDNEIMNKFFTDIIEFDVDTEDDLVKIPRFEEIAKEREKELKEKAMELKKIMEKLESMGYVLVEEEEVVEDGRID